jgi:hypothetical protein
MDVGRSDSVEVSCSCVCGNVNHRDTCLWVQLGLLGSAWIAAKGGRPAVALTQAYKAGSPLTRTGRREEAGTRGYWGNQGLLGDTIPTEERWSRLALTAAVTLSRTGRDYATPC